MATNLFGEPLEHLVRVMKKNLNKTKRNKIMTNKNREQGHQPLGAALRAPGACYQNKLK
jgi:hypothetical protein